MIDVTDVIDQHAAEHLQVLTDEELANLKVILKANVGKLITTSTLCSGSDLVLELLEARACALRGVRSKFLFTKWLRSVAWRFSAVVVVVFEADARNVPRANWGHVSPKTHRPGELLQKLK